MPSVTIEVTDTLEGVPAQEWDELAGSDPFMSHEFLRLLQATGCAVPDKGWAPAYLLLRRDGRLAAAAPTYLKTHSRGEFVFDHAWAEAYERNGLEYFPKLVAAVPFTPVSGPRLLARDDEHKRLLVQGLVELTQQAKASSVHVLFPNEADKTLLEEAGFMIREAIQFHWHNAGYASFEAFLATMSHEKRKKLKQDSKRVAAAGVGLRWLEGQALREDHLRFFYQCYEGTYDRHWGAPYLSLDFFLRLHASAPDRLLLVLAERDGVPVACALNVKGDGVLYGRYWGTTEFVSGLHFEACYAQAIAWCIERGFKVFEGGAQGEHKMARGLLPVRTFSAHWIAHRQFAAAIGEFLERETAAVEGYAESLGKSSPFRSGD